MAKAVHASRNESVDEDGNHVVLWYKTAEGRAQAIADFLRPGVDGDSLIAIILPLRELRETERHLRRAGFPVERLMEEGRLSLFASEEFLPANSADCSRIGRALRELRSIAEMQGRGLVLAGRVAPVLFERGEIDEAMIVEEAADSALGGARLLCLYSASSRNSAGKNGVDKVDRVHTRTLRETDDGKVRKVTNRKRVSRRKKGR